MNESYRLTLIRKGYRIQADGSWSKPETLAASVPNSQPERDAGRPLDSAAPNESGGQKCLRVRITRKSRKLLDADNFAGGCKPIIDQLRYAGLIPNDDPGSVTLEFEQGKVSKEEQGTEVIIEEII